MNRLITSPAIWNREVLTQPGIFLAGGITNCPDWQKPAAERLLKDTNLVIVNPRRISWDMNAGDMASVKQITWEYMHLRACKNTMFWFPKETDGPITLFELGSALERTENLFIGVHPDYRRKLDVRTQVGLRRPDLTVFEDINDVLDLIVQSIGG